MSVLVLNASFEPLGVVGAQRAVTLVWSGRAETVAADGDASPLVAASGEVFEVPAVVALTRFVRVPYRPVALTRRTLIARDARNCQIRGCDRPGSTVDHVVPRSRGGGHRWENVTLMCDRHNNAKSDRLLSELGWELKSKPFVPQYVTLLAFHPGAVSAWSEWLTPYVTVTV